MNSPPKPSRTPLDTALRLALTGVVLVLLWMGLQFMGVVHRMTADTGYTLDRAYALNAEDVRVAEIADQRARFPLPLFPGARELEFGEMEFNGRPFFRCDFDVSAPPEEILLFYRRQLLSRGWQDITEDAVRQAAIIQQPEQHEVLDFQNESFLRFYDHMMKTQASFSRPGGHVMIAVKAGANAWSSRVGIHYIEYSSPGEFSEDMQRSLGVGGSDQPGAGPATFAQNMGRQRAETSILTSRLLPADFRSDLVAHYRNEGWQELELPPPPDAGAPRIASMVLGNRMLFMQVSYDEQQEVSRAVVSTLMPRPQ